MIRWVVLVFAFFGMTAALAWKLPVRPQPFRWQPQMEAHVNSALHMPLDSTCRQTYHQLYRGNKLQILLAFGYKDARPARFVGDRYEASAVRQILVSPCPSGFHACGFTPDPNDGDRFRKKIVGPDRRGRTVELSLVHSSVGPDDEENRKDPFQKWQTEHAKKRFHQALQSSDIVLYNGHSRDGGGPDFGPPLLYKTHVNYDWYQIYRPGLKEMKVALAGGKSRLVGLFSCVSDRYFSEELKKVRPELGLVASDSLLYYTDSLKNQLGTLSSILGMWCSEGFAKSIQAGDPLRGSRLQDFFNSKKGD